MSEQLIIECGTCGCLFVGTDRYDQHYETVHRVIYHYCRLCHLRTRLLDDLSDHYYHIHNKHMCQVCHSYCVSESGLINHMRSHS